MCQPIFAQGSRDLAVGERLCARAKADGIPCFIRDSVPMNAAARKQRGPVLYTGPTLVGGVGEEPKAIGLARKRLYGQPDDGA